MVGEEDAQGQICRRPGSGAPAPDSIALVAFDTIGCMQEICIPRETIGKEADTVGFCRCSREVPLGSDHGVGPEIGLLHVLLSHRF